MKALPSKVTLLLILSLFMLPLLLAWMMFNGTIPFRSEHTRNLGQLIIPTVPLDWSAVVTLNDLPAHHDLDGYWVILYALPTGCSTHCRDLSTSLRQVHLASGQHQDRIKVALLLAPTPDQSLGVELFAIYPRFNLIAQPSAGFANALRKVGLEQPTPEGNADIFLVDPLGNIMMKYNGDDSPGKLSKDLKRLLTWSKLDKRS